MVLDTRHNQDGDYDFPWLGIIVTIIVLILALYFFGA